MQRSFAELSDSQWEGIKNFFNHHRPKVHDVRTMLNAILWLTRTGSQWRNLDSRYPPWTSVYYYFQCWQRSGLLDEVLSALVRQERARQGADPEPSTLAIDSQSVKAVALLPPETTGIDGAHLILSHSLPTLL